MGSEHELIKRGLKHDRRMQTDLYNTCYKRVFSSCLRILGDAHEAEDLMQEAFIHAFQRIDTFRGESNISTWICRIAINKCLDHLKKRRVKLEFDEKWENKATGSYYEEEDIGYDTQRILNAMKELPEGCRVIFSLHLFEEMDHAAIAKSLGIKEASSRAQYARAKNRIKELVKETYV
jgi:RNA polymerase sigma-70 factor (ECF subfamily)